MPLQYKTNILILLKDKGYTTTKLRTEKLLSDTAVQRLRENKPISWSNLEKICELLKCQPNDILEMVFKQK